MPKPMLDFYDNLEDVIDLKTHDQLLLVGEDGIFPNLRRMAGSVALARRSKELDSLASAGRSFERIFISRNFVLTELTVRKAAMLSSEDGLICFVSESEELVGAFVEIVERNWPRADVWICRSNVGAVCMTNARGGAEWQN